jgi:murein L,D-transpeptidase YcbB/YkuD
MKHKVTLRRLKAEGGWGPVAGTQTLKPGAEGPAVVALRDRLVRMGYLKPTASARYDERLEAAVRDFQARHGLAEDGVAGPGTLAEINLSVQERLQSVVVAMERERWMNMDRGARHIDVNLADFSAKIVDNGKVTFETRSVVGHRERARQSPEFSDVMEFMVINPSWFVPRSIATKEYLPELQANPNAVSHLEITDRSGRRIDRTAVDFSQFTTSNFPFAMRQPPSQTNALGLVKFMFPNRHNIYLHDTPQKHLFAHEVRAYSHGCIRLADPFGFAYALLARQEADPEGYFQRILATGRETTVHLKTPVPVHLMYRTALTDPKGALEFRRDVYGRDGKIWQALEEAGVVLEVLQS